MTRTIITEHRVEFFISDDGGSEYPGGTLIFSVHTIPDEAESARFGPPEHYDPGSGAEMWVEGTKWEGQSLGDAETLAEKWLENNRQWVEELVADKLADARDAYEQRER